MQDRLRDKRIFQRELLEPHPLDVGEKYTSCDHIIMIPDGPPTQRVQRPQALPLPPEVVLDHVFVKLLLRSFICCLQPSGGSLAVCLHSVEQDFGVPVRCHLQHGHGHKVAVRRYDEQGRVGQ